MENAHLSRCLVATNRFMVFEKQQIELGILLKILRTRQTRNKVQNYFFYRTVTSKNTQNKFEINRSSTGKK